MPRFVVLEHDWPTLHWDFLLEAGPVLRSWRLLAEPGPQREVPTEPNSVHRLFYLDYEGPVSGERGSVRRWDAGTFEWLLDQPNRIAIALQGGRLKGHCSIEGARWWME
jgi:hypothetical protein